MGFLEYIGGLSRFFAQTLYWSFKPPFHLRRISREIYICGTQSLFLVSTISIFTGIVLALQTAYQLRQLSSEIYIANIVALSLCRELGPVLTALIVAGRVGSSIAAQIGTMKITEQIDALRALATSPVKYLVVPKFLGMVISLPLLVVWSDFLGISGGLAVSVWKLGINPYTFIRMSIESLRFRDYLTGIFKALCFAIIISMVCSYEGLSTQRGAEAVGRATTLAVVKSFFLIIACDCLLTYIFFFVL